MHKIHMQGKGWCLYLALGPCVCVCVCVCDPDWSQPWTQHKWKSVRYATVDFHDNILSWVLKPWLCHTVPSQSDISSCFSNELSNMLSSSTDGLHTVGHSPLQRIIQSETFWWNILTFKETLCIYSHSC